MKKLIFKETTNNSKKIYDRYILNQNRWKPNALPIILYIPLIHMMVYVSLNLGKFK